MAGPVCQSAGMARIRLFFELDAPRYQHPSEVDCGWTIVNSDDGLLLHLSTGGSDNRQSGPKVSQTIQIDRARAQELHSLLLRAFPDLRTTA